MQDGKNQVQEDNILLRLQPIVSKVMIKSKVMRILCPPKFINSNNINERNKYMPIIKNQEFIQKQRSL